MKEKSILSKGKAKCREEPALAKSSTKATEKEERKKLLDNLEARMNSLEQSIKPIINSNSKVEMIPLRPAPVLSGLPASPVVPMEYILPAISNQVSLLAPTPKAVPYQSMPLPLKPIPATARPTLLYHPSPLVYPPHSVYTPDPPIPSSVYRPPNPTYAPSTSHYQAPFAPPLPPYVVPVYSSMQAPVQAPSQIRNYSRFPDFEGLLPISNTRKRSREEHR